MRKIKRIAALALCFITLFPLAAPASAATGFTNTTTYLRTSFSDDNYLELTISGKELTVSGKLIADNLDHVLAAVGEVRRYTEVKSGQSFTLTVDLSEVTAATPVNIYTRQSHNESYWSLVYESIYIEKSGGKYRFPTSAVKSVNADMLSAWLNPGEYTELGDRPAVKALSDEIVGKTTNEYRKAYLLHRWVAENIYYDYDYYLYGKDTFTEADDIIENRRTVASGYSELLMWLLRAQGIPAFKTQTFALGLTAQGGSFTQKRDEAKTTEANHELVEAFVDGRWIILDPSWDSNNEYENGKKLTLAPYGFYYFDITPEALANEQKILCRGDYTVSLKNGRAESENSVENGLVPSSWARAEISGAISKKLVPAALQRGYTEDISREDFCRLIMNMLRVKYRYTTNASVLRKFGKTAETDVFADTADADILAAYSLGIVMGDGNGKFHPERSITRQEAATMLKRAADLMGLASGEAEMEFTDISEAADWAKGAIGFISSLSTSEGRSVMGGVGDGRFSPLTQYTLEQAILTVYRLFMC